MLENPGVSLLTCPNCGSSIRADDAACRSCGADIQLMTLAADRGWVLQALAGQAPAPPASPEELVPRLGDDLVAQGYITPEQLQTALAHQAAAPGQLLGHTLVALGYVSAADLDQVIARRLRELQAALLEANRELGRRVAERTAELQTALARLTEFNQLKANFVANVSHELRTPLTHIKGYNVLMLEEALGPITPDQKRALEVCAASIGRLEQLINDLIAYAAAARGELSLNLRPVSVSLLVLNAVERAEEKAQRRQLALQRVLAPNLPAVLADEEKLLWTLTQLLDNAIKFTPAGGSITVTASQQGDQVVVSVRDTGIGIPANRLEEIFEPFRQLDGSTTRRYGGTGLGLALARRIVEAHGSRMQVCSDEGQGSTFAFALAPYVVPGPA